MLKLSKAQATAVAKKIKDRAYETRKQKVEECKKELINSKEYKQLESEIIAFISVMETIFKYSPKDVEGYITFNAFGYTSYLYHKNINNWKDEILENWINSKANNKYPYSSINENELISDIIFESIVSDDLNELIEKFANRYGKNNA